ncbi:phage portal protein [Paracoccus liaowanqingii]|uniref:Phage portal protein n=1 Tax=Paracoccus liaowanqingii TaxID=2560053 RepID=A0A4Z1CSX2_9RHOB|nr:phage portal protein [Paracoccus liaowanqingii]TGN68266.1 phage portal protein [Paracoccus liaowanqingii]
MFTSLARAFGRGDPIEQKSVTLTDPAALALFGVQAVASGMTVTAASAMRVPAVRRAVSLIAESVACLPFKVYEHDSREAAKAHPAFALVHDHANDWTSAEAFRETLTADALLTGHGYAQVARNAEGKPVFMLRMDPSAVAIDHDDFGEPSYRIRLKSGGEQVLPFQDVLHIQALHGVSPITLAREAIGLALAAEQHLSSFYRNGGRPSGVIRHPNKLDTEGTKKLAASWFTTHSGDQAGKTAVLDEGMEFQEIALKLADAEFSEVRREQVREIARAFGVPPASLFEMSRATWSNYEQAQREFLTGTLRPWIARWQAAYSRCLLTPDERASLYIEGNPDDMLSVDHAARATAFSQYRSMGVLTGNEVRASMNRPPLPGGDDLQNPFTSTGATPAPAPARTTQDDDA